MIITPALIPHADFHTGTWLLPVKRAEWYYFMNKKSRNSITNKNFLKSVDKPLRSLVRWLHKKGFKTTPSCAGHHISERNLAKIYLGLKEDREEIRNGGLQLKDIESGKLYLYRNGNYNLPWNKECFVNEVIEYQKTGVIGLRLGNRKKIKAKVFQALEKFSPEVSVREKGSVIFIFTNEDKTRNHNSDTWKKITRTLKSALK
jgi:hypothetical protein